MKKLIIVLFGLFLIPVFCAKSAQAVSSTDLVGWWKLDETTGTIALDSTLPQNNGTNYGALVGQPGEIGTSYRFDGVDDYIEVPETDFDITGPLTVEGWINPNNYNEVHTIAAKWRDYDFSSQRGYALAVHPNGRVLFDISFWGWDWEEIGTDPDGPPLPLNVWSHLAGTWDGTEMRLYVNGELQSTWSYIPGTPLYSNNEPVLIGATDGWGGSGRHFSDAYIDDVRIWTRALSAEEIVATMGTPDSDGDGINDDADACPNEDATGFDADQNGCIDNIQGLSQVIDTLPDDALSDEIKDSLTSKVSAALNSIDKEKGQAAVNQLQAFINEVGTQRGKKISEEAADLLIMYANNVIAQIQAG